MKRSLLFILFIILIVLAGCIFDSDDKGKDNTVTDAGNYTLALTSPLHVSTAETDSSFLELDSVADATYILFLTIHPSEDFEGSVKLSAIASEGMQIEFMTSELTVADPFTEVMLTPDSTEVFATYNIQIIVSHGGIADTTGVTMETAGLYGSYNPTASVTPFISWIHEEIPSITGLDENDEWKGYAPFGMASGGFYHVFYNDTWMIIRDIDWFNNPPYSYLLRRRGEQEPIAAACLESLNDVWSSLDPLEWDDR